MTAKATAKTAGVYTLENWSMKRWVGARLPWASSTALMMRASVECVASAVTR